MRRLLALLLVTLTLAGSMAGCGSTRGSTGHRHPVAKAVAGAVIVHHVLKKRHSRHPLLKAVGAGVVIHHVVKHHH